MSIAVRSDNLCEGEMGERGTGKYIRQSTRTLYCSNVIWTRISPVTTSFSSGKSLCSYKPDMAVRGIDETADEARRWERGG